MKPSRGPCWKRVVGPTVPFVRIARIRAKNGPSNWCPKVPNPEGFTRAFTFVGLAANNSQSPLARLWSVRTFRCPIADGPISLVRPKEIPQRHSASPDDWRDLQAAWFLCHRIRWAMTHSLGVAPKLQGNVEMAETFVGPKARHAPPRGCAGRTPGNSSRISGGLGNAKESGRGVGRIRESRSSGE